MTISFPRDFLNLGITSSQWGLDVLQSVFEPETSRQPLFQNFSAGKKDRWTGLWTIRKVNGNELGELSGWLTSMNGRSKTFFAFDPDRRLPNGSISVGEGALTGDSTLVTGDSTLFTGDEGAGIIKVNGAGQTGNSLNVIMDAVTNALRVGDYIQVGLGYHMILEPSNGGTTTLNFEPVMRSSPDDDDIVTFIRPVMVARLTTQFKDATTNMNKVGAFTFAWEEVVQ